MVPASERQAPSTVAGPRLRRLIEVAAGLFLVSFLLDDTLLRYERSSTDSIRTAVRAPGRLQKAGTHAVGAAGDVAVGVDRRATATVPITKAEAVVAPDVVASLVSKAATGIVIVGGQGLRASATATALPDSAKLGAAAGGCELWKCSCQEFSDTFGKFPGTWYLTPAQQPHLEWWIKHECNTVPELLAAQRAVDVVSILSFSNGQTHCNENTLLNAMYQRRPPGIRMIELLVLETSATPSTWWVETALRYSTSSFRVAYGWFNSSTTKGDMTTMQNPRLGMLRNMAMMASTGEVMINMDNDDLYHPDYAGFILGHVHQNTHADMVGVSVHSSINFNPDGTFNLFKRTSKIRYGGHMTSVNASALRYGCFYRNLEWTEEQRFHKCLVQGNHSIITVDSINGSLGNPYLLVKTKSPLSITNQRYFVGRENWNRLRTADVANIVSSMRKLFRDMHTMQRGANFAEYVPAVNDLSPPFALPGVVTWQGFQKRHPTFTSPTNYPVCTGFAAMIGQTFEAAKGADTGTTSAPAENAAECCNRCRLLFKPADPPGQNKDNVTSGHCGGFTYHIPTKMCHLGFTNLQYRPWTWDTHTTGARVSTCLKCGSKLNVDDTLT